MSNAPSHPQETAVKAEDLQATDPARVITSSAMHDRYGGLARFTFEWLFGPILYPKDAADRIHQLAAEGTVVYVARARSAWLALYFNHALTRLGLPLARFVGGINLWLWQPVGSLLKLRRPPESPGPAWRARYGSATPTRGETVLASLAQHGEATFLFLRDETLTGGRRRPSADDYLRALVAAQHTSQRPIFLVPHTMTDRAQSGSPRIPISELLFGTRRRPGQRRSLAVPRRRAAVRVADAINLKEFLAQHPEADDLLQVRRLRHELDRRISEEERVVAGPELPAFDTMARRVLRDPRFREVVEREATKSGRSVEAVEQRGARLLGEIAARYTVGVVKILDRIFDWVFSRIYDGIVVDDRGLRRAVEASRRGPLVLCPSHRSHVDYLVLSYVFWEHGVAPPHVAAGANLSFFPLGTIFRRCGAFFLRRSFRDDELYGATFRAYVVELLRQGNALEFFLEGTRSRTGKLLMPRFGMLGMVVDAWRRGARDDLQFVPVSIDYERLVEASAYEQELRGSEKKKEDLGALLRTTRVLRSRYGRVHVQFGEPLSLKTLAEQKQLPRSDAAEHDPLWRGEIERLGYRILHQVAMVCSVTPTAVAATALLGHPGRGMPQSALIARTHDIVEYLDAAAARLHESIIDPAGRVHAVLEAVQRFVEEGHVAVERAGRGDTEPIYRVLDERRVLLDFYKNVVMNHFAPASIVCRSLMRRGVRQASYADVHHDARFLSHLFKREFLYRADSNFDTHFDDTLAALAVRGIIDVLDDGTVQGRDPAAIALLAGLLDAFVQGYWVTAGTLTELKEFPLWNKELAVRAMERARRAYLEGRITRPESAGRALIETALAWMVSNGVVGEQKSGRRPSLKLSPPYDGGALQALIDDIGTFL